MRIMARDAAVQDGILQCVECGGPMVRVGTEMRCLQKVEPEELVAVGFIPAIDSSGKMTFDLYAKDQQRIQTSQAYSGSVEIDNAFLEKLGLNLDKIREFQLKHARVP
jgi:hypothetical protein